MRFLGRWHSSRNPLKNACFWGEGNLGRWQFGEMGQYQLVSRDLFLIVAEDFFKIDLIFFPREAIPWKTHIKIHAYFNFIEIFGYFTPSQYRRFGIPKDDGIGRGNCTSIIDLRKP